MANYSFQLNNSEQSNIIKIDFGTKRCTVHFYVFILSKKSVNLYLKGITIITITVRAQNNP